MSREFLIFYPEQLEQYLPEITGQLNNYYRVKHKVINEQNYSIDNIDNIDSKFCISIGNPDQNKFTKLYINSCDTLLSSDNYGRILLGDNKIIILGHNIESTIKIFLSQYLPYFINGKLSMNFSVSDTGSDQLFYTDRKL